MDELHRRFSRLDRVATPDLWNEAVGRAAELELARRPAFSLRMALIAGALLTAALAGTVAVGGWLNRPTPLPEAVTYENGMITGFECGGVVGIDPASLEARELVPVPDCDLMNGSERPAWSADGTRLAYLAWSPSVDGGMDQWVYEAARGESRLVGTCPSYCSGIDISPDGSLLASGAFLEDGTSELIVIGVDSGQVHRIGLVAQPRTPVFSPDGSHVAFSLVGGRSGIYVVDVRGANDGSVGSPTLVHGIVEASDLAWSPDGEWLAFRQWGGLGAVDEPQPFNGQVSHAGVGLLVARADGSETRILATGRDETGPMLPTWSPDSGSVAYVTTPTRGSASDRQWKLELWTVSLEGGEPALIYESGCCKDGFGAPSWSPDGAWIAFGVFMPDPSQSGTFLVRPDGSDVRHASDGMLNPVWQPIPND